ncbi:hypothetical protein [Duganella callida]|nr:hypothetical protein [Duganella callida]
MQNPFSPEVLRAAAEFVIVLDQHRFGAGAFLVIVVAAALVLSRAKRRS